MNKVIFIDWDFIINKAIFACIRQGTPQLAVFSAFRTILACLKRIEIHEDDLLILAGSDIKSWRTGVRPDYEVPHIRTNSQYNEPLYSLSSSIPFHVLLIDNCESKDIIGFGVRYYQNNCVIISTNQSLNQLERYSHVSLLSPHTKKFKLINNPINEISREVNKQPVKNLISKSLTARQYDDQVTTINLSKLPTNIETLIESYLVQLQPDKDYDINQFPYKSLTPDIVCLTDNSQKKIVTFQDSFKKKKINKVETTPLF